MSVILYAKDIRKGGPDHWPARYFRPHEIADRRTHELVVDQDALLLLDKLRLTVGFPLTINSGYRSPATNRFVGGAQNSFHMKGRAFDIHTDMVKAPLNDVLQAAIKVGFHGFGFYKTFLHVDTGPHRAWVG
jgi:zinc D-Ala-D-Ala carboxypeptidase